MRRAVAAAVLMVAGCNEPEKSGRGDTVLWHVVDGLPGLSGELVEGTEEILGLELQQVDTTHGAVTVFLADEPVADTSWSGGWSCTPWIYLENHTARVLAHEIGHAYGLDHVDDEANLMFPRGPGEELTDEQIDKVRKRIWETAEYCQEWL